MKQEVDVLVGDVRQCAVVPVLVILTRQHGEPDRLGTRLGRWERSAAARSGGDAVVVKAEPVRRVRFESAVDVDSDGEIGRIPEILVGEISVDDRVGERLVAGDDDPDWATGDVPLGVEPCPEDNTSRGRSTAGDRLGEDAGSYLSVGVLVVIAWLRGRRLDERRRAARRESRHCSLSRTSAAAHRVAENHPLLLVVRLRAS